MTGQHREMLDQVLALFDIQPDYDLHIMREGQSLTEVTAGVLTHLDPVLVKEKPDHATVSGFVQDNSWTARVTAMLKLIQEVHSSMKTSA